eukprot:2164822-Amphidinium_carterae.1
MALFNSGPLPKLHVGKAFTGMCQVSLTQALRVSAIHPACLQLDGLWPTDGPDMRDFSSAMLGQYSEDDVQAVWVPSATWAAPSTSMAELLSGTAAPGHLCTQLKIKK